MELPLGQAHLIGQPPRPARPDQSAEALQDRWLTGGEHSYDEVSIESRMRDLHQWGTALVQAQHDHVHMRSRGKSVLRKRGTIVGSNHGLSNTAMSVPQGWPTKRRAASRCITR
jgi:hypothetical protein